MKLNIKKGEKTLSLPKSCADLVSDADASDLKVLLYAALCEADGIEFDAEKAAHALMISNGEVNSSLKFWLGASVMKKGKAAKEEKNVINSSETPSLKKEVTRRTLPENRTAHFTSSELCEIAEINEEFKMLIDAAQNAAGHMFNTSEIEIIASLYSNLRLSSEYILALIGYYINKREKPLRYVEKVAYSFIDDGIDSADMLEEKLKQLEKFEGYEGMIRRLFGIGVRTFIDKERKMLRTWLEEYGYDEDIIKAAYEVTVERTGKASLNYANSVLKSWHEEGVKNLSDIEKKKEGSKEKRSNKPSKTTRAGTATARSFDVDEALTKALERSYKGADK